MGRDLADKNEKPEKIIEKGLAHIKGLPFKHAELLSELVQILLAVDPNQRPKLEEILVFKKVLLLESEDIEQTGI